MKCNKKCDFYQKSLRDAATNMIYVSCSFDGKLHRHGEYCKNYKYKTEWHPELYAIFRKEKNSITNLSRHYRIFTKIQILFVVAGGTSLAVCIPYTQHKIITKARKDYVQITKFYYEKHKFTFDQLMNFEDKQKLLREEKKTKPLASFFGVEPE